MGRCPWLNRELWWGPGHTKGDLHITTYVHTCMHKVFCCTSASSSVSMLVVCFCALWVLCLCCCLTDWLQRTMMETNPYLLGLTVVITIVHSVFEFLAFKNGTYVPLEQWLYDVIAWWICTMLSHCRHSVLEDPRVSGRPFCSICFLQCLPILDCTALHSGQWDQLCHHHQLFYWAVDWSLEDHQSV